jgi:hypothetical protein
MDGHGWAWFRLLPLQMAMAMAYSEPAISRQAGHQLPLLLRTTYPCPSVFDLPTKQASKAEAGET